MRDTKGTRPPFESWAVVELMGHVKLAGKVTEQEVFGAKLGRVEIPQRDGTWVTQLFGGASVYRISPVSEEVARAVALTTTYMPLSPWELPRPKIEGPKDITQNDEHDERRTAYHRGSMNDDEDREDDEDRPY